MKRLKIGNVLACEYAALGSHGKHTLINLYAGDIVVREFPATFPLAFYIEIFPQADTPQRLNIIISQGRQKRAEVAAEFAFEPSKVGVIVLPQLPLTFSKNGEFRVVITGEGLIPTTVLKKKVSTGKIPPA